MVAPMASRQVIFWGLPLLSYKHCVVLPFIIFSIHIDNWWQSQFYQGSATALPFPESRCDAAVMALVIFFVPDPAKGVDEMVRVIGPHGTATAYAWNIVGGGSPTEPLWAEMQTMSPPVPTELRGIANGNVPQLVD